MLMQNGPEESWNLLPLNHANCSLNHANFSLNHPDCSLNHADCSLNHANCSLNQLWGEIRAHVDAKRAGGILEFAAAAVCQR
jgi:hypothetical protein